MQPKSPRNGNSVPAVSSATTTLPCTDTSSVWKKDGWSLRRYGRSLDKRSRGRNRIRTGVGQLSPSTSQFHSSTDPVGDPDLLAPSGACAIGLGAVAIKGDLSDGQREIYWTFAIAIGWLVALFTGLLILPEVESSAERTLQQYYWNPVGDRRDGESRL